MSLRSAGISACCSVAPNQGPPSSWRSEMSLGDYMREHGKPERGYERFFAFLGLFVFSMCTLVLAGNFVLLIVGWAFVGFASYALISFWYRRRTAGGYRPAVAGTADPDCPCLWRRTVDHRSQGDSEPERVTDPGESQSESPAP